MTSAQVAEARTIAPVVCVQNHYNLVHRADDALIDSSRRAGIAYVPFFPLGGFYAAAVATLSEVAQQLGATPMQVALAWLLHRAPNILLIPGTSSLAHLRENLAAAVARAPAQALAKLDAIGGTAARIELRSSGLLRRLEARGTRAPPRASPYELLKRRGRGRQARRSCQFRR